MYVRVRVRGVCMCACVNAYQEINFIRKDGRGKRGEEREKGKGKREDGRKRGREKEEEGRGRKTRVGSKHNEERKSEE